MIRRMFLILLAVVLALSVGLVACGGAGQEEEEEEEPEVIELTFSTLDPPPPMVLGAKLTWFFDELEERTDGTVKTTLHFGGSLLAGGETYEGVINRVADVGCDVLAYNRGRFPLMEIADLPGYPSDATAVLTSHVTNELYNHFKPQELADTHVLCIFNFCPGNIDSRVPIYTMEDLQGVRVRATGGGGSVIEALGGTPIDMPFTDAYDALSKGVVDATLSSFENLDGFDMVEVTDYTIMCCSVGYIAAFYLIMNLDVWNSLPSDIQAILTDLSEEFVDVIGEGWTAADREGYEYGEEAGQIYIALSPEEDARWVATAIQPLEDDYIARMEALELPGQEWVEYKHELIETYSGIYPGREYVS